MKFEVTGIPLKEAGLDNIWIVKADGSKRRLEGFCAWEGQTVAEAITASLHPGEVAVYSEPTEDFIKELFDKSEEVA